MGCQQAGSRGRGDRQAGSAATAAKNGVQLDHERMRYAVRQPGHYTGDDLGAVVRGPPALDEPGERIHDPVLADPCALLAWPLDDVVATHRGR